jgi:hypothetical protein
MAVEIRADVQIVLRVAHDLEGQPSDDFQVVWYDALLEGLQLDPRLGVKLGDALREGISLNSRNEMGWIDDNVSYQLTDILDLILIKIQEVIPEGGHRD